MNMKTILKDSSTVSNTAVKKKIDENNTDFYAQSQSNSDLIKIVDDVETRLIQEEIKKEVDKNGVPAYSSPNTLSDLVYMVVTLLIGVVPFVFGYDMVYTRSALIPGILLMTLPASMITTPMIIAFFKRISKENAHYYNVVKLRKSLLEKSLKAEIVSGADELNSQWNEVSVINGDKAAKYLVRIVEDENTGFEQVDVKKFES